MGGLHLIEIGLGPWAGRMISLLNSLVVLFLTGMLGSWKGSGAWFAHVLGWVGVLLTNRSCCHGWIDWVGGAESHFATWTRWPLGVGCRSPAHHTIRWLTWTA